LAEVNNILHVIDTPGPGGAETIFVELAKGLDPHRWRSFTTVPRGGWVRDALVEGGVEPIMIPTQGSFDLRYLVALCKAVKRHHIDLIQTHLFTAGVYGSLAGLLCGVPVVSTFHGRPDVAGNRWYRAAKFRVLRRAAKRVVFVSESLRRFFLSVGILAASRTTVIADGIDVSTFAPRRDRSLRQELGLGDDAVLVGAVGNVRPMKSYDVFLKAAALLQRQSPLYRFVIVGETHGPLFEELRALRDRLGLGNTVAFTGFRDAVHRVMNNLDLYASTSSSEGFSLSVVQAMACGVPVVATKSGGPEEIIRDDINGLLVDTDSPERIAQAIERLRRAPDVCERLARAGRKTVEERFTVKQMVTQYENLYDQCLIA